eukprot:s358_g11.t6
MAKCICKKFVRTSDLLLQAKQSQSGLPDAMKSGGLSKLQSAVSQVKQVNALKGDSALEDSPTIKVCVRVRPFIKEEVEGQRSGGECKLCVEMPTETSVRMWNPEEIEEDMRAFEFDSRLADNLPAAMFQKFVFSEFRRSVLFCCMSGDIFTRYETLQKELGETMLEHAMNGFNNCIFAYGQTGSGKSYSVLGGKGEKRGLLPRVVEGLFDHFEKLPEGATYKTLVGFMEIYNEQIRDLLAPATDSENKKLEVKQHPVLGTIVPGLTEAAVASCEEVLNLVDYGTQMRHVSATAMNATSSRSHCIFTFKTSLTEPDQPSKVSQTHLVDLAGSERAGRTKATGDRLKEGAAINQSLSTLARVISELAKSSKTKKPNPPFRESKLTYILKESLCGNSKTVMMAAISPNFLDFDETLSTLKFAQSVKQVQTKAVQNAVNMSSVEAQLRAELNALKSQLKMYEEGSPTSSANVSSEELVFLKRRLEEQEQFCAYYGKDWDSLLAEERERMDTRSRRTAGAHCHRVKKSPSDKRQDHSSDEDADMEEDQESITCSLLELGRPPDVLPPGGRPSLCAPIRSSLAVVGPMAQSLLREGARPRAENLNRRVLELSRLAEETQELLNRENGGEMSIQVLVVVDPLDEETFEAGLVVQAASSKSLPSSWAWPRSESSEASETGERKVDWCSATELKKRLNWLKSSVSNSARSPEEMWLAAARATSGYDALEALQKDNAAMAAKIEELESRLGEAEGPRRAEKEGPKLRSQKARDAVKAIAASFETALGAIDSAQLTLQKVNIAPQNNYLIPLMLLVKPAPNGDAGTDSWELVGAMGGFENRASAFISQQDEQLQPVLREVLQLSRLAVGASTGSSELSALAAKVRQLAASSTAAAPLLAALDLHGLGECVARLPGRSVHTLCHCILNYALSMCEMLTEDICEAFRRVVAIRSCQAVARRFQDTDFAPLLDGNEQWRAELDCWKALLAPFPWSNARASVMSQVLAAADLSEPLTMHPQLVRSFEILRCLGADLLDNDIKGSVARLQRHGEKLACWASTEITENTLLAYRQSVGRKENDVVSLKPAEAAEEAAKARGALDAAAKKLGFVPSALKGRVPTLALVRLAARVLREVDEAALPPAGQALARQLVEEANKQPDPAIRNSILQFLLRVAQEFLTRATSKPKTLCLNFELLAGGSPSMQLLRDLETHPSAQLVLNNMALSELLQVMSRILEAHRMVHGEKELPHEALRRWSSRTATPAAVPPRELASLSADLEDFLKQNHAARLADLDESLASCAVRALNSLGEGFGFFVWNWGERMQEQPLRAKSYQVRGGRMAQA